MKTLTTIIKAAALGTAGIAVSAVAIDRVLSKIKETAVSLVSNISHQMRKAGREKGCRIACQRHQS